MTLLITGGGTGGHLSIAEALGEELGRRGIEVVYVGSVNGQDKQWFDKSNSPAGSHCIDLAVCHEARTRVKLTSCQTAKNSTSTTLRARIVDSSKQADSSENGNSSSLDKNPQDSRGNLVPLRNCEKSARLHSNPQDLLKKLRLCLVLQTK